MADIDETVLRALTAKAGLPMQFVFKDIKLFEALSKILDANKEANLDLVMKGGTALNKIYLSDIPRFSEDIDFDLFSNPARLKKIVSIDGFELQGPWRLKNTLRYHLSYSFLGKPDNIRVEFSLGKLFKTLRPVSRENLISGVTGTVLYGVPVYSLDDIVARKMNALRVRAEGKDVWDCYQAIPKTKSLAKAMALALESERLDLSVGDALRQTLTKLKRVDADRLMKLANPYIPVPLRPKDWKALVDELMHRIELLLKE